MHLIERSLTSTSSLVESESEEGHDRHNGSVFDDDEATVIEDVHTFDRIVSRGIGNLSLENTQTNESEDDLRDDISDLSTDDT